LGLREGFEGPLIPSLLKKKFARVFCVLAAKGLFCAEMGSISHLPGKISFGAKSGLSNAIASVNFLKVGSTAPK